MKLDSALRQEYLRLFDTCHLKYKKNQPYLRRTCSKILQNKARYKKVSANSGNIPWQVIAVIHLLEAGQHFNKHLHNGDPLTGVTTHVPKGRPLGEPPFTWEESAIDALAFTGVSTWKDWSIAGMLYKLESYNGLGYRKYHSDVLSPYLWSFSNHYDKGKYGSDGKFYNYLMSKQVGVVVVLKHLELFCAPKTYPGEFIKKGCDNHPCVIAVQKKLNDFKIIPRDIEEDGLFGDGTYKRVMLFQAMKAYAGEKKLTIDGVIGRETWDRLFN